ISSKLVQLMGGAISLRSEVNAGSVFSFAIPLVPAPMPAESRRGVQLSDLAGKHVLIVDDNATNRQILEKVLTAYHLRIMSVKDGTSALRVLSQANIEGDPFELLLVDYQMPGMDGLELVRRVRSSSAYADPIIMMLTSDDCSRSIGKAREHGIEAH